MSSRENLNDGGWPVCLEVGSEYGERNRKWKDDLTWLGSFEMARPVRGAVNGLVNRIQSLSDIGLSFGSRRRLRTSLFRLVESTG